MPEQKKSPDTAASQPRGSAPPSRIRLDSNLRRWFARNLGLWRSRRLYFFADDQDLRVDMLLRIELFSEPVEGESAYLYSWWPEKNDHLLEPTTPYLRAGSMQVQLCGHQLQRSQGNLSISPTRSQIRQVDEHEMVFESHDQDSHIMEHVRLVDQDRYRSCSLYSWQGGSLCLAEFHHEIRLEAAGEPLVVPAG